MAAGGGSGSGFSAPAIQTCGQRGRIRPPGCGAAGCGATCAAGRPTAGGARPPQSGRPPRSGRPERWRPGLGAARRFRPPGRDPEVSGEPASVRGREDRRGRVEKPRRGPAPPPGRFESTRTRGPRVQNGPRGQRGLRGPGGHPSRAVNRPRAADIAAAVVEDRRRAAAMRAGRIDSRGLAGPAGQAAVAPDPRVRRSKALPAEAGPLPGREPIPPAALRGLSGPLIGAGHCLASVMPIKQKLA